jgi:hypothetical protein
MTGRGVVSHTPADTVIPVSYKAEAGLLQSRVELDGDAIPQRLIGREHRAHLHGAQRQSPIGRFAERLPRIVLKRAAEVFVGHEAANQQFNMSMQVSGPSRRFKSKTRTNGHRSALTPTSTDV